MRMMRQRYYFVHRILPGVKWMIKAYFRFTFVVFFVYFLLYVIFHTASDKSNSLNCPNNDTIEARKLIQPNERTVKLVPRNACNNDDRKLVLLIMVTSHVSNRENRDIIRNTWAKDEFSFDKKFQLMFLLGQTVDTQLQTKVKEEYWKFGDILQESFLDTNATSTVKSLAMLKYFSQFCTQHAEYLFKVEENVYINIPQLYNLIHRNKNPILLTGSLYCGTSSLGHGHRREDDTSSSNYYSFLASSSYLMSRMSAWILYNTAMTTTIYPIENIYITGILPNMYNKLSIKERRELTRIPNTSRRNKSNGILDKDIYPENNERFNVEYLHEKDPCSNFNFISSSSLSVYEMLQRHQAMHEIRKTSRNENRFCFDSIISNKRQKSCNTRNTVFGGNTNCCGYIEYIWRNLILI